jgi:hypothetical protein
VEDVIHEGEEMLHCIGGYWDAAVKGRQYLFHVEYKGEEATAAVSAKDGSVQCLGPSNARNVASDYGTNVLNAWSRSLPTTTRLLFNVLPLANEEVIPF